MVEITRLVNTWFTSNTYILAHPQYDTVWVIDPGDVKPIVDWIIDHKKLSISGILLTHAHFDHIYGINDILNVHPDCVIYTANNYGKMLLFDAKKNASKYSDLGSIEIDKKAHITYYNHTLSLWPDIMMTVHLTPGHSPDSVCLQVENKMFTGDTLIKDTRTVTKLKGGSTEQLKASFILISSFKGLSYAIYPGHDDIFGLDDYDLTKATRKAYNSCKQKTI